MYPPYWLLSVPELRAQEGSSFCDKKKMTSCDFTLLYSFLTQANGFLFILYIYIFFFIDVLGSIRSTIVIMCPIIHFNALDLVSVALKK